MGLLLSKNFTIRSMRKLKRLIENKKAKTFVGLLEAEL